MLGKLFGSNARVKILKLFLLHPQNKYYIRQLSRDLKLQVNSVRRELENLEEFGLLVSNFAATPLTRGDKGGSLNEVNPLSAQGGSAYGGNPPYQGDSLEIAEEKPVSARGGSVSGGKLAANQEKKYYQANQDFLLFEEIKNLIVKAQVLHKDELIEKIKKTGKIRLLVLTGIFTNNLKSLVDVLIVGRIDKAKLVRVIKALEGDLGREINFTVMDSREFRYRRDMTDVFLYGVLEGRILVAVDEVGLR